MLTGSVVKTVTGGMSVIIWYDSEVLSIVDISEFNKMIKDVVADQEAFARGDDIQASTPPSGVINMSKNKEPGCNPT